MMYIHKDIGFYEISQELSFNYPVGETLVDLQEGKFIPLNEKQRRFLREYPKASIYEVYKMELNQQKDTLEQIRQQKLFEIIKYDASPAVNSFVINQVEMWLDRNTRSSLFTTIRAYKDVGEQGITLWTGGMNPQKITLDTSTLETLLLQLEIYAKQCYDITAKHKAAIQSMDEISKIIEYDHTIGYPKKLVITT